MTELTQENETNGWIDSEKQNCPNCGSQNTFEEICGECAGNGYTDSSFELMCEECNGTGTTGLTECDDCGELFNE